MRHHPRLHAGVPDFRGPTGIWTLQRAGLPIPKLDIEFGAAKPSITHQVLLLSVAYDADHRLRQNPVCGYCNASALKLAMLRSFW